MRADEVSDVAPPTSTPRTRRCGSSLSRPTSTRSMAFGVQRRQDKLSRLCDDAAVRSSHTFCDVKRSAAESRHCVPKGPQKHRRRASSTPGIRTRKPCCSWHNRVLLRSRVSQGFLTSRRLTFLHRPASSSPSRSAQARVLEDCPVARCWNPFEFRPSASWAINAGDVDAAILAT